MKTLGMILGAAALIAVAAVGAYFIAGGSATSSDEEIKPVVATPPAPGQKPAITAKPSSLARVTPAPKAAAEVSDSTEQRIAALEAKVRSLEQALAGVDLQKASSDRQKLFAAEEGYLKADEYAALGQHAIAGEGYLTFLQHHPQHPDARDVMKKARDSFLKAGYKDKAFWVQDEMMKANPQHQLADMEELAHIEKDAGMYDQAMQHMNQAAQLDPNPESRLWKRLYWAWFTQLHQGNAAGLDALRQVQQEIAASGVNNPKLNDKAAKHTAEWQQQLTRTGN